MALNKDKETMITAFQREIGKEAFIVKRSWGAEKSRFFLSDARQKIFQKLCEIPCCTVNQLASNLSLKASGIRWHLEKLRRGGFVNKRNIRGAWLFYPTDMLTDEDIEILSLIQEQIIGNLLKQVIRKPGLCQKELSTNLDIKQTSITKYLKELENIALITYVVDGKFKRYYATDKIIRMYSSKRRKTSVFKDNLLIKLKREMYSIEILRSTPQMLSLKLSSGFNTSILSIPINPYERIFGQ
jgi:predicted transcriptional regulator